MLFSFASLSVVAVVSEGDSANQFQILLHELHGIPGAFTDDIPLPLCQRGQYIYGHPAVSSSGIKVILQAGEGYLVFLKYIFY